MGSQGVREEETMLYGEELEQMFRLEKGIEWYDCHFKYLPSCHVAELGRVVFADPQGRVGTKEGVFKSVRGVDFDSNN